MQAERRMLIEVTFLVPVTQSVSSQPSQVSSGGQYGDEVEDESHHILALQSRDSGAKEWTFIMFTQAIEVMVMGTRILTHVLGHVI